MTTQAQLPIRDDFPVQWDSPEEATRFWTADLMHWPHGLSPLSATMDGPAFGRGLVKAAEELCMPFRDLSFKYINGYMYQNVAPWSRDPEQMAARMQQMQMQMIKNIPGLLQRWYQEYEPEVRSINDETLNRDYSKLSEAEISEVLERVLAKREREGFLHFLAVWPATGAVLFYEEVYTNLFGKPRTGEHLDLLQGFPNKSIEAGEGIWHLAQEAKKSPEVMKAISSLPPGRVDEALRAANGGGAFRAAVGEYTRRYGWRGAEMDIAEPTWVEDPAPVYMLVREYAARDDYDPRQDVRSLVAAREAKERALLEKLAGGPVELFRQALAGAQQYLPVQEDHNFWIDQQGVCVQRVPVLEAARRLVAADKIAQEQDVFLLHYEELQDALRGGNGSLRETVERRRAERDRFRKITPPEAIGTPPPPEEAPQANPMYAKFFGAPPEKHPDPRMINGNAASAGKTTGTARVILSLDDADRLKRGEILVCPATTPPWTPLFAVASAIVTDHGGVLSHTAIVAREYQIPAVVGTKLGTSLIADGQKITVDGSEGTVRLET